MKDLKSALERILHEILAWSSQFEVEQPKRKRRDYDDKSLTQTIGFWLQSYHNVLILQGWAIYHVEKPEEGID